MKFLEFVDRNNEICAFIGFLAFVLGMTVAVMFFNGREDARKVAERMNLINAGYEEKPTTVVYGTHWEKK